jgi:hypothetical protein
LLPKQLALDPNNVAILASVLTSIKQGKVGANYSQLGGEHDYKDQDNLGGFLKDMKGMGELPSWVPGGNSTSEPDAFLGSYQEVYQVTHIDNARSSFTITLGVYNDTGMASLTHFLPDRNGPGLGGSMYEEFFWTETVNY